MSALDEQLVRRGVVRIGRPGDGYDGRSASFWGSGFFVAPGWVLTCAHVVGKGAGAVWRGEGVIGVTTADDRAFTGELAFGLPSPRDPDGPPSPWPLPDLAIVRVPEATDPDCLWLSDRSALTPAEVGMYGWTAAPGAGQVYLSATGTASGGSGGPVVLRGGFLPPGCSGGPVLDREHGAVIGLSKGRGDGGSGLAVPVTALRALCDEGPGAARLWHEVLRAHDRHHRVRYLALGDCWPRAHARADERAYGFTPDRRTQLYGALGELEPPASGGQVLGIVNEVRQVVLRSSYTMDVHAPRSWREGAGLLYAPHDGSSQGAEGGRDLELEAVVLYAAKVCAALGARGGGQGGDEPGYGGPRYDGPAYDTHGQGAPGYEGHAYDGPGHDVHGYDAHGYDAHGYNVHAHDAVPPAGRGPDAGRTPPPGAPVRAPGAEAAGTAAALEDLRRWVAETALTLRNEVVRASIPGILAGTHGGHGSREAAPARADVLVEIDPDVYGTHAWRVKLLGEDGRVTPVRHNETGVPREELERDIRAALAAALDQGDAGDHLAAVDFMMPRPLFDEPVDEWRARPPEPDEPFNPHTLPLGRRRSVVLRDGMRRRQGVTPEWRSRWKDVEQGPLHAVPLRGEVAGAGHDAALPESDSAAYGRLSAAPRGAVPVHCARTGAGRAAGAMDAALSAGHPVVLWRRCDEGHEDCAAFQEHAALFAAGAGDATALPEQIRTLRNRNADPAAPDPGAAWARHIVLLYDPPHGPPFPGGPLRAPPLRPGRPS